MLHIVLQLSNLFLMARQLPLNANLFPGMYLFGGFALRTSRLLFGGCWGHSRILQFLKVILCVTDDGRCKYDFSVSIASLLVSGTLLNISSWFINISSYSSCFIVFNRHFIMFHQHFIIFIMETFVFHQHFIMFHPHPEVVNWNPASSTAPRPSFCSCFHWGCPGEFREMGSRDENGEMSKAVASNLVKFFHWFAFLIRTKVSKVVAFSVWEQLGSKKVVTLSQHGFSPVGKNLGNKHGIANHNSFPPTVPTPTTLSLSVSLAMDNSCVCFWIQS